SPPSGARISWPPVSVPQVHSAVSDRSVSPEIVHKTRRLSSARRPRLSPWNVPDIGGTIHRNGVIPDILRLPHLSYRIRSGVRRPLSAIPTARRRLPF